MITKEQSAKDYAYRSEILTNGLRRDVWQTIAWRLEHSGEVGLAQDIREFLESKESN
jgi:hypothetical protein